MGARTCAHARRHSAKRAHERVRAKRTNSRNAPRRRRDKQNQTKRTRTNKQCVAPQYKSQAANHSPTTCAQAHTSGARSFKAHIQPTRKCSVRFISINKNQRNTPRRKRSNVRIRIREDIHTLQQTDLIPTESKVCFPRKQSMFPPKAHV